jgi:hypothetical protein
MFLSNLNGEFEVFKGNSDFIIKELGMVLYRVFILLLTLFSCVENEVGDLTENENPGDYYIASFDINKPKHPFDNLYTWLPIDFTNDKMSITWNDSWNMEFFGSN